MSYWVDRRCGELPSKKCFKCFFRFLSPVHPYLGRAHGDKVLTEIGPLLVHSSFSGDLSAFIISAGIKKFALLTAAKISPSIGAGLVSGYCRLYINLISTKGACHDFFPPNETIFQILWVSWKRVME